MMLNWKAMTLGQHARVHVISRVRDPEVAIGKVHLVTRKEAIVDARWNGSELEVFGNGSLWPHFEEVLQSSLPSAGPERLVDGVHCFSYSPAIDCATMALRAFETCVRAMMRQPGWTVVEIQL